MGSGIVRDFEFDGMPLKERYFFTLGKKFNSSE